MRHKIRLSAVLLIVLVAALAFAMGAIVIEDTAVVRVNASEIVVENHG
ncbi:MAG: hypothetical protein MJ099_03575 [Clostridia bacterium]|nr:hypothetical protein [Clostridia bacterium]